MHQAALYFEFESLDKRGEQIAKEISLMKISPGKLLPIPPTAFFGKMLDTITTFDVLEAVGSSKSKSKSSSSDCNSCCLALSPVNWGEWMQFF